MAKKQPVQELLAQCNSDKYCIPASLRVPAVFREGLQNLKRYLSRIQYLIVLDLMSWPESTIYYNSIL